MNAKQTRNKYTAELKRFFDFIKIPGNTMEEQYRFTIQMKRERSNGYNSNNNRWFLNNVLRFIQAEKERVERKEVIGATLRNYVKVIKLFCETNNILIPWKKIPRDPQLEENSETIGLQLLMK
jgi:hypothetical protein